MKKSTKEKVVLGNDFGYILSIEQVMAALAQQALQGALQSITERDFYLRVLPLMRGKVFHLPRSYGHAEYRVDGMRGEGPEDLRFVLVSNNVFFCNQINLPETRAIGVTRLGGYDDIMQMSLGLLIWNAAKEAGVI